MKTRNKAVLDKYRKYGEHYDRNLPYESRLFKLSKFQLLPTTRPLERSSKAVLHKNLKRVAEGEHAVTPRLVFFGASITQHLSGPKDVWNQYFAPFGSINMGVGGDRTEHVLHRVEDSKMPPTVEIVIIHCGTNNLGKSPPSDIASGVLSIGVAAVKKWSVKVVITGLLHCDLSLCDHGVAQH